MANRTARRDARRLGTCVGQVQLPRAPLSPSSPIDAQSAYASRLRDLPALALARGPSELRYDLQYGAPMVNSKLIAGLAPHAGGRIRAVDPQLGMHVVGWLPGFDQARLARLIELARDRGLGLHSILPYYDVPPPQAGLLLGFASLFPRQIDAAMKILGRCLRDVR